MVYAQINNGIIVNAIVVDENTPLELFSQGYDNFIRVDELSPVPGKGWSYDGSSFSAPAQSNEIPDVTPRQIRQALVLMGVSLTDINNALNSLPEPQKTLAMVEWEYSIAFQRHRPLVESVGVMLGWSSGQLDSLWRLAATL